MKYETNDRWPDRAKSLFAVFCVHAAIGYALLSGMGMEMTKTVTAGLNVIDISTPLPPEPVRDAKPAQAKEGSASEENLKASATQIVAPKPAVKLDILSPIIAAPIAGPGRDDDAGASDRPGPGTGGGGHGQGAGSGSSGDGTGAGGIVSGPRHLSGAFTRKDIPRNVWKAAPRGDVIAHFTVGTDGRASDCHIKRSSGHAALDAITCRLIEARFRFEPARDASGRAVAQPYGWLQQWWRDGRGPQRPN